MHTQKDGDLSREAPLIVSFYTIDTPYEEEVERLKHSCKKWNLEACIEGVKSQGSWERNCAIKPKFILDKLKKFKRPIFWVDADSVFLKPPKFAQFMEYDFSVRFYEGLPEDHTSRVASGTVFVNCTEKGQKLIESWHEESTRQLNDPKRQEEFWDQVALRDALKKQKDLKVLPMAKGYSKIFDIDQFFIGSEEVIIEHYQASRRFKNLVTAGR